MTDKIFFHPETGKPLHPVPVGATIPKDTPYGVIYADGDRAWRNVGCVYEITLTAHLGDCTFFTAEPIAPPAPPLPTEPGSLIRATNRGGVTCAVLALDSADYWVGVDQDGDPRHWENEGIADWSPVMVVPNGLGVLDETDKRPVVDNRGDQWEWDETRDLWTTLGFLHRGTKTTIDRDHGPLRLAGGDAS